MALAIANQWTGAANFSDLQVITTPTAGNWLIACVGWRMADGTMPALNLGDLSRNLWTLLASPTTLAYASHAGSLMQVEIWACPAATYEGWDSLRVFASTNISALDTGSLMLNVAEVSGMVNGFLTVDSVTVGSASAATTFSIVVPAPAGAANCLVMGAALAATSAATITATGAGFTGLTQAADTAPDAKLQPQWRAATASVTPAWSSTAAVDWCGVAVAIRETGTVPPDSLTPYLVATAAQASGVSASVSAPVTTAVPAGDSVAVVLGSSGGADLLSVADSKGNTYSLVVSETGGTPRTHIYQSAISVPLTTSDTITATFSTSGNAFNVIAAGCPGGMDVETGTAGHAFGTSTAPSAATTALSNSYELIVAGVSNGNGGGTPSWPTGWTVLSTQHTGSTQWTSAAYRTTTGTGPVTASATVVSAAWTTVVAAFRPRRTWPAVRYQVGFGYDMTTPLSAVQWTDQSSRFVDTTGAVVFSAGRGIPYELGQVNSEPADLKIRNDDGAYTPRDIAEAASANAAGTATTIKIADADATNIHVADFFRIKTSALVLKELTVFQVTGVASAAGTTTVTFARADGVAGGAQASTASGDVYAGIQIDTHIPWRKIDYWNGKWYPSAVGWFGSLPQTWSNPYWGVVPAVGIDPLATLTAGNPTAARGEILRRHPTHYWPLSDPGAGNSDSDNLGTAQDASGNGRPPLRQVLSKYGKGANNVADFGAATQDLDTGLNPPIPASLLGDSGSGWQQSGLTSAEMPTKGYALVGQSDDFPPISGGVTILGASAVPLAADLSAIQAAAFNGTMMILRNTDPALAIGQGAIIKLSIDKTTLRPSISVWDKDTHARTDTTPGAGAALVQQFWTVWMLTFNRTSWMLYCGGNFTPIATGSCDLVATFGEIDIGGEADEFFHGRFWNGIHTHIAVFDRQLTDEEYFNLSTAIVSGSVSQNTASEVTSDRVVRKLDSVNWTGPRIVTPSDNAIGNEGDEPGSVVDLLSDIADYEDGLFFVDAAGQLQWRGHLAGYYQTVRQVLGEDTSAGEIPFQPGQEMPYDLTYLYNRVEVGNAGVTNLFSRVTRLFPAADPAPYAKGLRTLPRATRLGATEDAFGLAWWLLSLYHTPQLRVTSVEIDCASYPAAWGFCLGAEIGDLITVKKRPLGAPAISLDCRIIQVKRNEGPGVARFTLALAAAAPPVLVLGDPAKAVLGNATIGF